MRTWELTVGVDIGKGATYRRLAEAVARDIERGRLRPGERLPSTRILAAQLDLNRNTVVAAFEELRREGWIEGRTRSGTFVPQVLPARTPDRPPERAVAGFDLVDAVPAPRRAPRDPDMRLLLGGVPDLRLVPTRELARAYRLALRGARGRRALDYAEPLGAERLRTALAELLVRTRGVRASADAVCVVRGSQHGLALVAQSLLRRGDVVAVEGTGYPPGWQALRLAGLELVPVPVDGEGLDVAALEAVCARRRVSAVLVTPHHQYPTTVSLSPARRRALLALAARARMMVIEDDYDFEFHYDGPPILPLAASDPDGVVVYVGTMSKSLAPGLRLGYVVAHPEVVRRVANVRAWTDTQGDQVVEQAVAQLLEDGELQRHTRRLRRLYQSRRDALVEALGARLPMVEVTPPSGGMAAWVRAPGVDTAAWAARGLTHRVACQGGAGFRFDGGADDHLRLGFAACNEAELDEAVERLAAALPV